MAAEAAPRLFRQGEKKMPEETMITMYQILSEFTVEERDRIVEILRLLLQSPLNI